MAKQPLVGVIEIIEQPQEAIPEEALGGAPPGGPTDTTGHDEGGRGDSGGGNGGGGGDEPPKQGGSGGGERPPSNSGSSVIRWGRGYWVSVIVFVFIGLSALTWTFFALHEVSDLARINKKLRGECFHPLWPTTDMVLKVSRGPKEVTIRAFGERDRQFLVVAAAPGKVVAVREVAGLWDIVLEHGCSFITVYAGLAECKVIKGEHVEGSEFIGIANAGSGFLFSVSHPDTPGTLQDPYEFLPSPGLLADTGEEYDPKALAHLRGLFPPMVLIK